MSNLLGLEEEVPGAPLELERSEMEQRLKSGANWFYWIAGLSLVNSVVFAFGSPVLLLGGLGFTLVMDAFMQAFIEEGGPTILSAVAVVFNLVFVAIFAFFGYYAGRRFKGAFLAGIILYSLDSLLVLFLGDYFMAGFHAFAMIFIVRGYLACRSLVVQAVDEPQPASV